MNQQFPSFDGSGLTDAIDVDGYDVMLLSGIDHSLLR
jgi:hypothetical protein